MSARASISALNSVLARLSDRVKQATADKQTLYTKYQKIQDFNKLTVRPTRTAAVFCFVGLH